MLHWDWGALRAYVTPCAVTIVALIGIVKDSKDYRERAQEPGLSRWRRGYRTKIPFLLHIVTVLLCLFTILDIHAARKDAANERFSARLEKSSNEDQIKGLKSSVDIGNGLLTQQRKDFLDQFSGMSDKVNNLQTQIKTADLEQEASRLSAELLATRKSMESPKAKLSFSFATDDGADSRVVTLPKIKGSVHVAFTVENNTDVTALEGVIVLVACDNCKIVGNPTGFTTLNRSPDNRRNFDFQHLFAHSRLQVIEAEVKPPAGALKFSLGIEYRCRNCENYMYDRSRFTISNAPKSYLPSELTGVVYTTR